MQNTQGIKLTTHLPPCAKIKNAWTSNLYTSICLLGVYTDNFTLLYFTYGRESWMVRNKDRKKIYAFELWMCRRILRVLWTERRMNVSVLEEVQPKRPLEAAILRLKLRYFGQVMRAIGSLKRDIMLGQVAGHRRQGKPRMHWLDSIKEATGLRLEVLKEIV